jgi:pimeloyl-ACP methyl ester carboxylesterase
VQEDFTLTDPSREISARIAATAGAQECWMDLDGAQMRYLRMGSGPPLILLHGLFAYSFSWRYIMPALARYATVYAPDMMGAGFSDRVPDLDCCMRANAKRLLRFIADLGVRSFDLVGTSHGGAVAMMAAEICQNPKSRLRLRKLVLVAPVNPYSAHGKWLAPFFATAPGALLFRSVIAGNPAFFPYLHGRLYADHGKIPAGSLQGYTAPMAKPGLFDHALNIVRTWTEDLRELEAILPKIAHVPTLLVWGRKDPAVYASSAEPLSKHFVNVQTVVFDGIGHLPYEECPDEFNRVLINFLQQDPVPKP